MARKPAAHKDFISSWLRLEKCSVISHLLRQEAKSRELKRARGGPEHECGFGYGSRNMSLKVKRLLKTFLPIFQPPQNVINLNV